MTGNRKHRYAPWEDAPPPEPKTRAEAAALARTWDEWEGSQPGVGMYGGRVFGVPWALDWQRNPSAPLPDGYIWVRCLCFATICRPPEWRGRAQNRDGRWRPVKPAWTVGDRCGTCAAPYRRLGRRDGPYVPPEGFALARCMCRLVICRPHELEAVELPCRDCGAPWQQMADSDQGYRLDILDDRPRPGWREYLKGAGLLGLEEEPIVTLEE